MAEPIYICPGCGAVYSFALVKRMKEDKKEIERRRCLQCGKEWETVVKEE